MQNSAYDMKSHAQCSAAARRRRTGRYLFTVALSLLSFRWAEAEDRWLTSGRLEIGVTSLYDNNILRYSDKYITRFNNREDQGRFHNSTLDDLILVNTFRFSGTMQIIGSLNTTANVDYRRRTYTHNSIKDWSYVGFGLRQDISKKLAAQISYSYIPTFFVRHFRDEDWTALYGFKDPIVYQPYAYTKDEAGGWLQYTPFPGTRVRGVAAYARYFYNEHFTEYDCRNTTLGIEVYHSLQKSITLDASFEVVFSRGDGTVDMNPSYDQNIYTIGAEFQLPKLFGRTNSIDIGAEYSRSCYTSTHFLQLDPNHAGRDDRSYRVSAAYTFHLLDNLGLALTYGWHRRDVKTSAQENAEYLSAEKDYVQYQIGLEIRYVVNFIP
jgi:hypothetical protein